MNSVNLTGIIETDLEPRVSKSGVKYLRFNLLVATTQRDQDGHIIMDAFDCVVYGDKADTMMKKVAKGNSLGVSGSLKKNKAGGVSVSVNNVSFSQEEKKATDLELVAEKVEAAHNMYRNEE